MKYVPTQEDCNIIRKAAAREAVPGISEGAVLLEPGYRSGPKGENMNILLTTDDPKWQDTDLADYGTWKEFRAGFELTDDGSAVVDFYIRRRFDPYADLHGNVTAYWRNGKLVRVHGYPGEYYSAE